MVVQSVCRLDGVETSGLPTQPKRAIHPICEARETLQRRPGLQAHGKKTSTEVPTGPAFGDLVL
jgi:hypothetical protein